MVNISIFVLLGILEMTLLVVVLTVVSLLQWRRARRELAVTQQALREARSSVKREVVERRVEAGGPQRDYADFLDEQLEQSSLLLGDDPGQQAEGAVADSGDASVDAKSARPIDRQMLAARHQFLQLELDVQKLAAADDPEDRRRRVISGMQALLDGLDLQPIAAISQPETDAAAASTNTASRARSEELKLRDQIEHLRSVIGNQHDVMRELRQLLEEHGADSEELQEALRKLGDVEAQGTELQRCLEVMELENARLKQAAASGAPSAGTNPDAEMLRDLVGSQQRTIGKLQSMLQNLTSDPAKARELGDAINKIQRSNNELNSCVMVLEDENSMLRGRVETLEERLAGLDVPGAQDSAGPIQEPDAGRSETKVVPVDLPIVEEALQEVVATLPDADAAPALDGAEQSDTDLLLADLFGGDDKRGATGKTG